MDIKIDNTAWSPSYNKFVFLDFGFCKYVKEPLGFKSETRFSGTYSFACPQMKKLYLLNQSSLVDLYYNDIFCLIKTIELLHHFSYL